MRVDRWLGLRPKVANKMKFDFMGFSIEPEQRNLVPVRASSSSEPLEGKLAGTVVVDYSVVDTDKMMQSFETKGRTYITDREIGGYFKAVITIGDQAVAATPVSVGTVNFGVGEYNVTYLVSDQKEQTNCKNS